MDALAITPDGSRVVSATGWYFQVWNTESGEQLGEYEFPTEGFCGANITADGRLGIYSCRIGIGTWEMQTGSLVNTVSTSRAGDHVAVALTPNGTRAVLGLHDGTALVWDLVSKSIITRFSAEYALTACAVTPDGQCIILGDKNGYVHFLRLILEGNQDDPA